MIDWVVVAIDLFVIVMLAVFIARIITRMT